MNQVFFEYFTEASDTSQTPSSLLKNYLMEQNPSLEAGIRLAGQDIYVYEIRRFINVF
jgi:hypothetical protein